MSKLVKKTMIFDEEHLKIINGISDVWVEDIMNEKIQRQLGRIEAENNK